MANYVSGSVVRKESREIQKKKTKSAKKRLAMKQQAIKEARQEAQWQEARKAAIRREQIKAQRFDFSIVAVFVIALLATFMICVQYLMIRTSINGRMDQIEQYEKTLDNLRSENDALENSINTAVDLDHIYEVATGELGMVYAGQQQVITYDKTESEYVRQYEDIPKY